jgi:hypothetical protein
MSNGNKMNPQLCFVRWGEIPGTHPEARLKPQWFQAGGALQSGFYLANDGGAAHEITVESFEIDSSVLAQSKPLARIKERGEGFALVWLEGSDDNWDLLGAMAKASDAKYGGSMYRPDFSVPVNVTYRDAENNWYRSSAKLTYIRSQGRLEFGASAHETCKRASVTEARAAGGGSVKHLSDEAQARLNLRAGMGLQAISDAFRAYGEKIGAPEWASYDYGETARFVEFFVTTAKELVEAHLQEYGHPTADAWPSIAQEVLRRIKNAVSEQPPLPKMVHTYPWRPSELFGRQDFLEAMLAMISSHFPQPEAESSKVEPTVALPDASSPANYPQAVKVAQNPQTAAPPAFSDDKKPDLSGAVNRAPTGRGHMSGACAFRRQEDMWSLMFNGKSVMLKHLLGFVYIVELLRTPRKEIEALALASRYTASAVVGMTQIVSGGIEMADEQAIQQVQHTLNEKRAQMSSLKNDKNWPRKGELKGEIEQLEKYLKEARRAEGVRRKTGGTMNRARTAVTNAIHRAFRKIRTVHPDLAAHLEQSIRTGSVLAYMPEELPDWEF